MSKTTVTTPTTACERTTISKVAVGDFISFDTTKVKSTDLVRVAAIEKRNAARNGHRAVSEYAYTLADGRTGRAGVSTAIWRGPAPAKPARKTTPAAVKATGGATRKAKAVAPEALEDAAGRVLNFRQDLADATAERNRLMAAAKAAGMTVADIARACGFASTGAAQNAIASGEAG